MKEFHNHGNLELLNRVPDCEQSEKVATTFSHLCDGTRLRILWILCHSEECVTNIAEAVEMSAPAVSHHLKLLKQAEIITSRRSGKEIYYRLADNEEATLVHKMIDDIYHMKCNLN